MINKETAQPVRLALVVPCYNEADMLEITIPQLTGFLQQLIDLRELATNSFIVFVDDGSTDSTWQKIVAVTQALPRQVHGICLARNVGHQNALLCGLHYVSQRCDAAISIDADLQHDFAVIPAMLAQYRQGKQLVYGVRDPRDVDGWIKRYTSVLFYKMMRFMGVNLIENHADFRLMSSKVLTSLQQFGEINVFLRGIVPLLHKNTGTVYYTQAKRAAGKSKYSFKKMLTFAWTGITSFSVVPLRSISWIGALTFIFSLVMAMYALYSAMLGRVIPGWASVIIPLYILGGMIMLSIGIVGEYIGKLFLEAKQRPRFLIDVIIPNENKD